MTVQEMEAVIVGYRLTLQDVLRAAFILEEIQTIGGNCCLSQGSGRGGDPAHLLDRALSVTRHIRGREEPRLRQWVDTDHIEPERFPRAVLAFWYRVPHRAAADMAKVAPGIV